MKKQTKRFKVVSICLVTVFFLFIAGLASAADESGKINLTKSATKIYDGSLEDNLTKGRYSKVSLSVSANPYSEPTQTKLDIVLILDGSKSMSWGLNGKDDTSIPNRTDLLKQEAHSFINNVVDETDNVRIGIVEFGTTIAQSRALTNNKQLLNFYVDYLGTEGGTNVQAGINEAKSILDNGARQDAKKVIVILTDGVPTYYTENGKIHGDGSLDLYECTKWNKQKECIEHNGPKPSEKAKIALDNLKKSYPTADVYTITFGNETEAASILATVNPTNTNPIYDNLTATDGDELRESLTKTVNKEITNIGKKAFVTDIIPSEFSLTDDSKRLLETEGVIITTNNDNETVLTWNIGDITAGKTNSLSYIVKANDNYHGSMYTNKSAVLTVDVDEKNPYYDKTTLELAFNKPTVEIPAIANDDHYNNISSYSAYEGNTINGTSILTNDLVKKIKKDGSNVTVKDDIIINENTNTVKNQDGSYSIYKDKILQGVLKINHDGTFTFTPEDEITGEVSFSYHIKSTITPYQETNYVYSNDATVTLNIKERQKMDITGYKIWIDGDNQDGLRPDSIEVALYKNDKLEQKTTVTNNDWKYVFEDLYVYEKGHENDSKYLINYSIKEVTKVDGYKTSYEGNNIINTHTPEVTTISGSKTWDDNNNQDGLRPDSITVNLTGKVDNKTIVNETQVVTAITNWKYSFINLDKYYEGKEIVYTIDENTVDGYSKAIKGYNITNTHTPITMSITGEKVWVDSNDRDGFRPNSIEVTLNGKVDNKTVYSETKTVSATDNWLYTFENIDKYYQGKEIAYSVTEQTVKEYETSYDDNNKFIIVNTHQVNDITVSGSKTWDDNNDQDGIRPDSITVNLTGKIGDEVVVSDSKVVTANDNWSYRFTELPEYKNGKLITYSISEDEVTGYSTSIENYNIKNTHTPEVITINGSKTWDDNDNQDGIRPETITINLLADNQVVATTTTNEENKWNFSFENVAKYSNGIEITYSIEEVSVDGYTSEIKDFDITNTHTPEVISYKVTKTWDDNNNQDGIRPDSITVNLLANGNIIDSTEMNEANNWTYIFENLPKYSQGRLINYEITEDEVIGYIPSISNSVVENEVIITNTHEVEKIDITINKTWDDGNNKFNSRPDEINVSILANGELFETITITSKDNWTYTLTDLDKYSNGQLIEYTIIEDKVLGYETIYDGFNITNKLLPVGNTNVENTNIEITNIEITPPNTGVTSNENKDL